MATAVAASWPASSAVATEPGLFPAVWAVWAARGVRGDFLLGGPQPTGVLPDRDGDLP
jgi:hypothetical protein